eukprot:CAMPEP_0197485734 /NCGR_PEP_ID=MMETSP1311-20131121/656_1 /TAXON_ID=464262 /ORGANISM="Genus nov. species nov., Strain RCC856" /LENGTH=169 /DNA_ID=CAMNT_0043028469 /DNA_START=46 /DNA_END=555 /DNA_ORIENTATION=+
MMSKIAIAAAAALLVAGSAVAEDVVSQAHAGASSYSVSDASGYPTAHTSSSTYTDAYGEYAVAHAGAEAAAEAEDWWGSAEAESTSGSFSEVYDGFSEANAYTHDWTHATGEGYASAYSGAAADAVAKIYKKVNPEPSDDDDDDDDWWYYPEPEWYYPEPEWWYYGDRK